MTQSLRITGAVLWGALALAYGSGCISDDKKAKPALGLPFGGSAINEINILATPVALNFDDLPGPDGFVIKVYASEQHRPKPVPIDGGKLEILMFDGFPGSEESDPAQPRRVWSFTAAELKSFQIETSIGTGYQLAPVWGEAVPQRSKISVIVRYTSPKGSVISSAPSIISVAVR